MGGEGGVTRFEQNSIIVLPFMAKIVASEISQVFVCFCLHYPHWQQLGSGYKLLSENFDPKNTYKYVAITVRDPVIVPDNSGLK